MLLHHSWNTSFKPVIWTFIISLLLTTIAYSLTIESVLTGGILVATVLGLAFIQGIVQLIFYMHLGVEERPRWNLLIFLFMLLIMAVIVLGSLWIIENLNYNLMRQMESSHG